AAEYYQTEGGVAEWNAFWETFDDASLDEKFEMARRAIDQEPHFDGEWAFTLMIEGLLTPVQKAGEAEWNRWVDLVDHLRTCHPEIARQESGALAAHEIEFSLWAGQEEFVEAVDYLFARPVENIDHLFDSLETLAYGGIVDKLPGHFQDHWTTVRESPNVMSSTPTKWARWALRSVIARWAEEDIRQDRGTEAIEEALGPMVEGINPAIFPVFGEVFLGPFDDELLVERAEQTELEEIEALETAHAFCRVLVEKWNWPPFKAMLVERPFFQFFRALGRRDPSQLSTSRASETRKLRKRLRD
ncbi:MAG: hypothetical protein ABEN55_17800, partial [Bradymonadaceae bacterium]